MAEAQSKSRTEVLVQDLHIQEAAQTLPDNVFPISMKVTMDRRTREDVKHPEVREPDYPVTALRADPTPYVPSKQVYFFNPAEISDQPGKEGRGKTWNYYDFTERLDDAIAELELEDPSIGERMYINGASLVEIPAEYVRYEDSDGEEVSPEKVAEYRQDLGHTPYHINARASRDLYEDRAEMVIARFGKRHSIQSKKARDKMRDELPNKVIKPLRLTELAKVHAKEHRGSFNTTAASTKRMYFSTSQAISQYNNPDLRPRYWMERDEIDDDSEDRERPLTLVEDEFKQHMPALTESEFVSVWEFEGYLDQQETFVDTDADRVD